MLSVVPKAHPRSMWLSHPGAAIAWSAGAAALSLLAVAAWLWWARGAAIILDMVAMWCG